jgi:hypothetical protein
MSCRATGVSVRCPFPPRRSHSSTALGLVYWPRRICSLPLRRREQKRRERQRARLVLVRSRRAADRHSGSRIWTKASAGSATPCPLRFHGFGPNHRPASGEEEEEEEEEEYGRSLREPGVAGDRGKHPCRRRARPSDGTPSWVQPCVDAGAADAGQAPAAAAPTWRRGCRSCRGGNGGSCCWRASLGRAYADGEMGRARPVCVRSRAPATSVNTDPRSSRFGPPVPANDDRPRVASSNEPGPRATPGHRR